MRNATWSVRVTDTAKAARRARAAERRSTWSRERLEDHQRRALSALLAHAIEHSPFYRERFRAVGVTPQSPLETLPVLEKSTMVEQFDRFVCDPRLTQSELRAFVERHPGDVL